MSSISHLPAAARDLLADELLPRNERERLLLRLDRGDWVPKDLVTLPEIPCSWETRCAVRQRLQARPQAGWEA